MFAFIGTNAIAVTGFGTVRTAMTGTTLTIGWARATVNSAVNLGRDRNDSAVQLFRRTGDGSVGLGSATGYFIAASGL